MKITVLGAAGGEVTGSCYLVQTRDASVLVDCGLFQGGSQAEARNRATIIGPGQHLDAVLLTHAHLDHTGRLPLLPGLNFAGPVYCTPATIELAALILRDSAKLQRKDAERRNRKLARAGRSAIEPLYSSEEAEKVIGQLEAVPYQKAVAIAPGIQAIWAEAGHMLGSASIQLLVTEGESRRQIVFSGDLGPKGIPILKDFEPFHGADLLFLESTYGDRDHRPFKETVDEFVGIVRGAVQDGGKMLVPTFAVGRAQLIITLLGWMFRTRQVKPFPIFLDSPMAIEASAIYARHPELFDDEMLEYLREKPLRADLPTLRTTVTAEESKKINEQEGPFMVLAGAGMCNAGRILHHLRHHLWNPKTHVLIVGFQGSGTLGRRLVDGDKMVSIYGEEVAVSARVHTLGGFSAHSGQTDLLDWYASLAATHPQVVLTHGESKARDGLAAGLKRRHDVACVLPEIGQVIDLG